MNVPRLHSKARLALRLSILSVFIACGCILPAAEPTTTNRYETRATHDPNGIGKFYHGREIAQVMGHEGADWLERPERNEEENTTLLVQSLELKPSDVVADIGAGTGYLSRRLAQKVSSTGKVICQDIQPEMLTLLRSNMAIAHVTNYQTVLGTVDDPKLAPNSLDTAILVDVYHEFDSPFEMISKIVDALKSGGRLIFVEFRAEDPNVPIKAVHKMAEAQVKAEMKDHPLRWAETKEVLPWQHLIVFKKGS